MRILLVHGKYFNSWEALGLGYIAAYLRIRVPDVVIDFKQGSFDEDDEVVVAGVKSDWVLFSATSPSYGWCACIAKRIKGERQECRTVVGGYHASAIPTLIGPEFDHVVIGEGEQAVVDLVTGVQKERLVFGRPMGFEELPWPDREAIKNHRNIGVAQRETGKRITSFQGHRGCPFLCRYCCDGATNVLFGGGNPLIRSRPVEDLLNEIWIVSQKYQLDFFKFCDPTWNTSTQWVCKFCSDKLRKGPFLPFFANIHANMVQENMFSLMSEAMCREIGLGIESGSDRILKSIGKGITKKRVREVVALAKKHQIRTRGYFIVGLPGETEADLQQTEQFAEELDLEEYGFTLLCPYPGSDYYRSHPEMWKVDWSQADEYSNDFWHTECLTNNRMREIQTHLVEKFRSRLTQRQASMKEFCGGREQS